MKIGCEVMLFCYLLLLDGGLIPSNGSHGLQLRLLPHRPLGQLPQRQVQAVPVLGIVLQTIPVGQSEKNSSGKCWCVLSGVLECALQSNLTPDSNKYFFQLY